MNEDAHHRKWSISSAVSDSSYRENAEDTLQRPFDKMGYFASLSMEERWRKGGLSKREYTGSGSMTMHRTGTGAKATSFCRLFLMDSDGRYVSTVITHLPVISSCTRFSRYLHRGHCAPLENREAHS